MIGQFSEHSGAIKWLRGGWRHKQPALWSRDRRRQEELSASQQLRHRTFNRPSCVKDLQHFLPHAWKGKTWRWVLIIIKNWDWISINLQWNTESSQWGDAILTDWSVWSNPTPNPLVYFFDSAKDIKHKISFLLQKPEPPTAEPKPKEKSAIAAAAAAAAAKRSADWFTLWFDLKTCRLFESGSLKREVKQPSMSTLWMPRGICQLHRSDSNRKTKQIITNNTISELLICACSGILRYI